jgi:hypothetical protein
MPDYLSEVGKSGRVLAIFCLTVSTLIFGPTFLGIVAMAILDMPTDAEKARALIGSAVVFGVFAGASLWMLVRLLVRTRARNGLTLMPIWFIEFFGVLFVTGNVILAIVERSPWLVAESLSVCAAMIFVRRNVRAKLQQMEEPELSDQTLQNGDDPPPHEDGPLEENQTL